MTKLPLSHRVVDLDLLNARSSEALGEVEFYMGQLDEAAADSKKALRSSEALGEVEFYMH